MYDQYQLSDKDEQELIQQAIIESNKSKNEEDEERLFQLAIKYSIKTKDEEEEQRLIQKAIEDSIKLKDEEDEKRTIQLAIEEPIKLKNEGKLLQQTIEESNKLYETEYERKLMQWAIDESNKLKNKVGEAIKPLNTCLSEALARIMWLINTKNEILNINELIQKIDNFLRNYHKSFEHYENADPETKKEIDKNYNIGVQLPFNLFEVGLKEFIPNRKIHIFIRTYIIDTENYDVILNEVGNGKIIDGIFVLFTSSIKYGDTKNGERLGGHFETFKSKLDINEIKKKLESNENTFDILKKI